MTEETLSPLGYVGSCQLPTPWGDFTLHGFAEVKTGKEHLAITMGSWHAEEEILIRVHSECLTGDALFSQRCDCGAQLEEAMKRIADEGRGAVLYLRQEGRGIGLANKIRAYRLQDGGVDTVLANEVLGFPADLRDYRICKPIFEKLGVRNIRLMTNNPEKISALRACGIEVRSRQALIVGENPANWHYLATKKNKLGHLLAC